MLHAYVRCSTVEQNPQLQIDAMRRAGVDRVWLEQRSAVGHRPELSRLLYSLRRGDVLVVWKLDRLARSLSDLLAILARLDRLGASIRSLTEPIDTSTPIGRMLTQLLGSVAEFERSLIRERTEAGRVAAMARGVVFGRKRTVSREQAQELLNAGHSQSETARRLGCTRASICRLLSEGHLSRPVGKP